jgi:hypothetical protein
MGITIGMLFPLIALVAVLFIRIGFLWMVIAASPLLIIANIFKDTLKFELPKSLELKNIIKIVFAPVITVFALSISLIFMTTLNSSLSEENANKITVFSDL